MFENKLVVTTRYKYCSSACNPLYKKLTADRKDSAQVYKHDKNMEGKSYDDRIRLLGLWTLEERRNRHDLIELFKIFMGLSCVKIAELFMLDEKVLEVIDEKVLEVIV